MRGLLYGIDVLRALKCELESAFNPIFPDNFSFILRILGCDSNFVKAMSMESAMSEVLFRMYRFSFISCMEHDLSCMERDLSCMEHDLPFS